MCLSATAQSYICSGTITDPNQVPVPAATIVNLHSGKSTIADKSGQFHIHCTPGDSLRISATGFAPLHCQARPEPLSLQLQTQASQLAEVIVSTGYETLSKEKVTGSFTKLSAEQINRRTSTNLLDRLDGISPGLSFNKNLTASGQKLGILIRGASTIGTIDGKVNTDPLIILDNFPFEGDISSINPNDIESITILKDASAASIWGARAGNGVIVLTTKKGRSGQALQVSLNSNFTRVNSPNLRYSPNFLPSAAYIEIERNLFDMGFYDATLNNTSNFPSVSPVVELLNVQRKGQISANDVASQLGQLSNVDLRDDLATYFYRPASLQQYNLSLRGGGANIAYSFSAGLDRNLESKVRNDLSRITLNSFNSFTLTKRLTFDLGFLYSYSARDNNNSLNFTGGLPSYTKLADAAGNPLIAKGTYRNYYADSVRKLGWLDWNYRPLQDLRAANNTNINKELVLRAGLSYKFSSWLDASLNYQLEQQQGTNFNVQDTSLYFTRDLINKFTTLSGGTLSFGIPRASILDQSFANLLASNYRGQLHFNRRFAKLHKVNAIAGGEVREIVSRNFGYRLYGYDDRYGTAVTNLNFAGQTPTSPRSTDRIPSGTTALTETTNRYLSAYANLGYSFKERYTLSLSGRRDGANIFGVKVNQQITPLWSAGLAWKLSSEDWWKLSWLPNFGLRGSYGYNGNVYNASAYLTASYGTDFMTGAQTATITRPPNANLKWERVQVLNVGIDFKCAKDILAGSIDLYQKRGLDLVQSSPVPSSSGFSSYFSNSASIQTRGVDLAITSLNLNRRLRWTTTLNLNYTTDKVIRYDPILTGSKLVDYSQVTAGLLPVNGRPLYGVYAYRSAGLDPLTGDPLGYQGKSVSKSYASIINSATIDSLEFMGSSKPTLFGNVLNSISFGGFNLSFNCTYKFGYWFKRPSTSINLQTALNGGGIADYQQRWQKPGDEKFTSVPSMAYPNGSNDPTNRNNFYQGSRAVIERGDHIRFQDISLSFTFNRDRYSKLPLASLQIYGYLNNLGLIWKSTDTNLDPDWVTPYALPNPRSYSIGLRANF